MVQARYQVKMINGILALAIGLFGIWYAFQSYVDKKYVQLDRPLNKTYDYIIVGAGSSGAVIANRLSEDPDASVLLIEAGGSDLEDDNIQIPLLAFTVHKTKADWGYYTVSQKKSHFGMNEQKSFWPRGRVLGGTSNLNYMAYVRGNKNDYNQWAKDGCTGWSYKDVLPYFLKSEDIQIPELQNSPYHNRGGYLTVSKGVGLGLCEFYRKASEEIGHKTVDRNGEDQLGFSYEQNTVRNGERCSTAKAFIRPAIDRPNLHISINSLATKVIIENKQAKGVEVIKDNKKVQFSAKKEIILSGGAVNSPVLLMLSGVGPKEHLQDLGIHVHADLPVGKNLQDHLMTNIIYSLNTSMSINTELVQGTLPRLQYDLTRTGLYSGSGLEADFFGQIPNRDQTEPDYADYQNILFIVAQDEAFLYHGLESNTKSSIKELFKTRATSTEFTSALCQLHPKSKGTIRLQSSDPFDYPLIDPNYLDNQYDIKVHIAAIRKTQELMNTSVFRKLNATLTRRDFPGFCDKQKFDSDEYWECIVRHFSQTVYHPTSTCRMGSMTDKTAVVDPELRVKGISGLRVADASVMRDVPSGNTNAPSIMIGEKASDLIRGKDTVSKFREQIKYLNL